MLRRCMSMAKNKNICSQTTGDEDETKAVEKSNN